MDQHMRLFPHQAQEEERDLLGESVEDVLTHLKTNNYIYMVLNNPQPALVARVRKAIRSAHLPIEFLDIATATHNHVVLYRIGKSREYLIPEFYGYRALKVPGQADMYFHDLPEGMFTDESRAELAGAAWRPV